MYTIRSFRENMREAFNKAEAGETVTIERYGQTYKLVTDSTDEVIGMANDAIRALHNNDGMTTTKNVPQVINRLPDDIPIADVRPDFIYPDATNKKEPRYRTDLTPPEDYA